MSSDPALEKFLRRLKSRSILSADEERAILSLPAFKRQVRRNFDIVSPGQTVEHACLIGKGIAARYDQMADGKRQITAFHLAGDMCDLHSVVCSTAAWGIAALSETTVVQVPHTDLRALVARYPNVALAFWRDVTADASIFAKWIGNLGRRDARARVAHILCELGLLIEAGGLGTRNDFELDVSQSNLADAVGLTAVHMNRTLQSLRADSLIETHGRHIQIADWERMTHAAEFDPAYLLFGKGSSRLTLNERVMAVNDAVAN